MTKESYPGEAMDDWAALAVSQLFTDEITTHDRSVSVGYDESQPRYAVVHDEGYQSLTLGAGASWPVAVADAWTNYKDSKYARKEAVAMEAPVTTVAAEALQALQGPPPNDEFIEEFVKAMHRRDLLGQFLIWYGEKHDEDPGSWPRTLNRGEWLTALSDYISGLEV